MEAPPNNKLQDLIKKNEIEQRISDASKEYFSLLDRIVENAPFIQISMSEVKKSRRNPIFTQGDFLIKLPNSSGVYFVYKENEVTPFYCGESSNLNQRLTYHFSDSVAAIQNSTLKKYFPIESRTLAIMANSLRLKVIEVPIGRNDVEAYFHEKFKINTKSVKKAISR